MTVEAQKYSKYRTRSINVADSTPEKKKLVNLINIVLSLKLNVELDSLYRNI